MPDMNKETRTKITRVLALVFSVGLTIALYVFHDKLRDFAPLGYPGIFILSFITNATLILPVPGVLITSAMGAVFNPFWVAIAAGAGAALGETSGFLAGYSGQGVIERTRYGAQVEGWMKKYGPLTIFFLSFIPNPLIDIAGISAGMLKMSFFTFLFWCMAGKILKMMIFSFGGSYLIELFPGLF
jgi:membrane protein YqaA with SNARE-associated domain